MGIIDTHAHIYDTSVYGDVDLLVRSLKESGIEGVLLPGTDLCDDEYIKKLVSVDDKLFYPMLGVHPDYVDSSYKKKINEIEKDIKDYNYFGIGEIGLDYHNNGKNVEEQKLFFDLVLDIAINSSLPVSVHSRNSFEDSYRILKSKKGQLKGVIHCFTGDFCEAKKYIDIGLYLGIGGILTFKNSTLRETLTKIPLEYIVLETDSPFLSPEPLRGSINTPCNLKYVVSCLSKIYNVDVDKIEAETSKNARNIFKIS